MYPLRFEPRFRRYLWGGHRLAEVLGKPIGDQSAAESWEIVDHGEDQSVVKYGPFAGQTLRQLIAERGGALLGHRLLERLSSTDLPPYLRSRFPLLLKFLDANQPLSVQVHPNDRFAATLTPPDLGKTEAWYIVHADPGAKIYAGLAHGVTKAKFVDAIEHNEIESVLHCFQPRQGDCVFIRAGTIHAIGAGLLIAEVQQASDTTFRVYDWGRVDQNGEPRSLHIEQAIKATDFELGPVDSQPPTPAGDHPRQTLVDCDKFVMNRHKPTGPVEYLGDGRFRILTVTKGSIRVIGEPSGKPLKRGETVLLPACLDATDVIPASEEVEILEISVPDPFE
jgi:mannose-6-phosphate isomerase